MANNRNVIYLDNNATTPLDPRVLEEMMPFLTSEFGNASSLTHKFGRTANGAVEKSRQQIASLLNVSEDEIIFTSGATEGINMVLKGTFHAYQSKLGKHFITCKTEHPAVMDCFSFLQKQQAEISYLDVDENGNICLEQLKSLIRPDTVMIALMAANNETGVCHDLSAIAQIAQQHQVLFFCDATQYFGKKRLDLKEIPIDILAISAHKIYGPKGAGAVYIRKKTKRSVILPLLHGGSQEHHLRAGTYNVPALVGFGKAAEIADLEMESDAIRLEKLRNRFESAFLDVPEVFFNAKSSLRMPHVSNMTIRHLRAEQVMTYLPQLAFSTGAACISGNRNPSHVLLAMGLSADDAKSSIRISLGRFNTEEEVQNAQDLLLKTIYKLRSESPAWQLFEKGLI